MALQVQPGKGEKHEAKGEEEGAKKVGGKWLEQAAVESRNGRFTRAGPRRRQTLGKLQRINTRANIAHLRLTIEVGDRFGDT